MRRSLVIGYGNLDRHDDGLGFHVVNRLRRHLGQEPLAFDDNGLARLGGDLDSVFMRQLVPELIETAVDYDRLVFVDAHIPTDMPNLMCIRIGPDNAMSGFTHQLHPSTFLTLLKVLCDHEPQSHLLSVSGCNFDFGRGLSANAARLLEPAFEVILRLLDTPIDTGFASTDQNPQPPQTGRVTTDDIPMGVPGKKTIHLHKQVFYTL
jgi:hydrogenase maturation protease